MRSFMVVFIWITGCLTAILLSPVPAAAEYRVFSVNAGNNRIVRADLPNGNNPQDFGNPGGLLGQPEDIALDSGNSRLYMTSSSNDKIVRTDTGGTSPQDIGNPGGIP